MKSTDNKNVNSQIYNLTCLHKSNKHVFFNNQKIFFFWKNKKPTLRKLNYFLSTLGLSFFITQIYYYNYTNPFFGNLSMTLNKVNFKDYQFWKILMFLFDSWFPEKLIYFCGLKFRYSFLSRSFLFIFFKKFKLFFLKNQIFKKCTLANFFLILNTRVFNFLKLIFFKYFKIFYLINFKKYVY